MSSAAHQRLLPVRFIEFNEGGFGNDGPLLTFEFEEMLPLEFEFWETTDDVALEFVVEFCGEEDEAEV